MHRHFFEMKCCKIALLIFDHICVMMEEPFAHVYNVASVHT